MISLIVNTNTTHIIYFCIILVCCCSYTRSAKLDNITTGISLNDRLNDGDYLESPNKNFQMGFFQTEETSEAIRRYVGIWYTIDPKTIIWVANRDKPVNDFTGSLTVSADGNAKVLDKKETVYFNTTVEGASSQTALMLLDSGNVVLKNVKSVEILWQSFDNPTDTFLPGMTMVGTNLTLTSWKSLEDPGVGLFQFRENPIKRNRFYIWKNVSTTYHWKSGDISENSFDDNPIPSEALSLLSNKYYQNYSVIDQNYTRLVMSYSGNITYFSWQETKRKWVSCWHEPKDACSVYRACGTFGICNPENDSCSCMDGFEPVSLDDDKAGCRRTSVICQSSAIDTFVNVSMISIDDTTQPLYPSKSESDCKKICLEDCQCQAYSYSSKKNATQGCSFWNSAPDNLKMYGRHNISFRVSVKSKGNNQHKTESQSIHKRKYINDVLQLDDSKEEDTESIDVPYFELETLIAATNDFSEENRLGQGGFGPVYKGKLPGGQEIAVKRLASLSGQGLQEFKNEVILIAKLQHRNLVRLLGYSIRGEEKMLLYEYLPNRSLDRFIFDQTLCKSLDWEMRFNIIMGIARGLNYLHHESRLRIIHRDLKTSNILLDEDMNPKISDFGLARIIKGKDIEAMTNRIVGTFGYMSPEYVLDGLFSIKSDVFSFGVVLLEILSGKRNIGYYQSQKSSGLLEYAWNLWLEDTPLELIDQIPMESCNSSELLKCIIVGLMCVQGNPEDRPTMTNVLGMFGGDITTLPTLKEPAFVTRKGSKDHTISSSSSSSKPDMQTRSMLTITEFDAR